MAFVFKMPEVGEGVVEAEVTAWKVAVGERIERDQPLCDITTDKAVVEVASPEAGVVTRLFSDVGEIVKVHTPLVEIDTEAAGAAPSSGAAPVNGVAAPAPAPAPPAPSAAPPAPAPAAAPPRGATAARGAASPAPASDPSTRGEVRATPAVRRRARELGIEVGEVPGTGPGGRVTHADLEAFEAPPAAKAPLPKAPVALPQAAPSADDQVVKIVGIRRKIAERMAQAKLTAPHFTYVEEVDCTRLVAVREELKVRAAARGVKLTFLPFFAKACSVAFRDFPNVNAWMHGEQGELVVKGAHHLGFACDTPHGLMVPVVRHVEQKSILQIAAELQDLFDRTRAGQASREELTGSTFTITGVGNIGGVLATPILNLPEVGILGVNAIKKRAVVVDDRVEVRPTTFLSNSFDHRIIDGAVGARFTARVKELIEAPESLLLELA